MNILKITIIAITMSLLSYFFVMAVLGENNKSKQVVLDFFELLQNNKFDTIYNGHMIDNLKDDKIYKENPKKNLFLLKLSLIDFFNLTEENNFSFVVKKNDTWFPYLTNDIVRFDISVKNNSYNIFGMNNSKKNKYIDNLVEVTRENGKWTINNIKVSTTELRDIYKKYFNKINYDEYMEINNDVCRLKPITINNKTTSKEDKEILAFMLDKFLSDCVER